MTRGDEVPAQPTPPPLQPSHGTSTEPRATANRRSRRSRVWIILAICAGVTIIGLGVIIVIGFSRESSSNIGYYVEITDWRPHTVGFQDIAGTVKNNYSNACSRLKLDLSGYVTSADTATPVGTAIDIVVGPVPGGVTLTWHWDGAVDSSADLLQEDQPAVCMDPGHVDQP